MDDIPNLLKKYEIDYAFDINDEIDENIPYFCLI